MKQYQFLWLLLLLPWLGYAQSPADSMIISQPSIRTEEHAQFFEYRLPSWGYTLTRINVTGHGYGGSRNNATARRSDYQAQLQASPWYRRYWESETRHTTLILALPVSTEHSGNQYRNGDDSKRTRTSVQYQFQVQGNYYQQHYMKHMQFLDLAFENDWQYFETHRKTTDTFSASTPHSESHTYGRDYQSTIRVGWGTGRVRNITPMIQALRFRHRYEDRTGETFIPSQVHRLAHLFAKKGGYTLVYDRPAKFFYAALPADARIALRRLSLADLFYLTDTFQELLGQRKEGRDIAGGLLMNYSRIAGVYSFSEHQKGQIHLGAYARATYYHNLSVNCQVGGQLKMSWQYPLSANTELGTMGRSQLTLEWLWNIIDHLLITHTIQIQSEFGWGHPGKFSNLPWARNDQYSITGRVEYFIENRISLLAQYRLIYEEYWNTTRSFSLSPYSSGAYAPHLINRRWDFTIGVQYYFHRQIL